MLAIAAGIIAVFLWALAPGLIKTGMNAHNFSWFLLMRYVFSTLIIISVLPHVIRKASQLKISYWVATCISIVIHNGMQVFCLQQISIFWYTLMFSLTPVLTVFFFEKPSWYVFSCFCLAILGTVIILDPSGLPIVPNYQYIFALVLCVLSWVVLTVLLKKIHQFYNDIETTFILNFSNLVSAMVIWGLNAFPVEAFSHNESIGLTALVISSPIALWLFSYAIRQNPLFGISAQYLEIIFGIFISTLIYNEVINSSGWIGGSIIVLSIVLLTFRNNILSIFIRYRGYTQKMT